uniref:Uncharacterized protein n=1 Tax=Chrysotila carterae TaxID=13221 RepID=A0A7S4EVJ1_CHRCT
MACDCKHSAHCMGSRNVVRNCDARFNIQHGMTPTLRDKDGIACALEHFERAGAAPIATACLRQKSREPRVGWQPHALLEVILRLLLRRVFDVLARRWEKRPLLRATNNGVPGARCERVDVQLSAGTRRADDDPAVRRGALHEPKQVAALHC